MQLYPGIFVKKMGLPLSLSMITLYVLPRSIKYPFIEINDHLGLIYLKLKKKKKSLLNPFSYIHSFSFLSTLFFPLRNLLLCSLMSLLLGFMVGQTLDFYPPSHLFFFPLDISRAPFPMVTLILQSGTGGGIRGKCAFRFSFCYKITLPILQ